MSIFKHTGASTSETIAALQAEVARLTTQLAAHEEHTRHEASLLAAFRDTRDLLLQAPDEAAMLRLAVDLGHHRLGFERLSIWLCGDDPTVVTGTFGIDEHGTLRDERASRVAVHPASMMGRVLAHESYLLVQDDDALFNEYAQVIGHGSHAVASLWDGRQVIGSLSADTYLSGRPFTTTQLEIMERYAMMLGYLITEMRLHATHLDLMHLLRLLLDNTPHPVFVRAADGTVMLGNRALAETYGLPTDALPGKTQAELYARLGMPPAYTESALEEDRQVLEHGLPTVRVKSFPDADGVAHWFRTLRCKVALRDGTPCVLVLAEDITEPKAVGDALKASEARYRRIVETAQEGICMLDAIGYVTYLNTQLAALLGYSVDELLGRHAFDFFDHRTVNEMLLLFGRRMEGRASTHDLCLRRKDGTDIWVSMALTPVIDERQQLVGILAMVTDISARKAAETALERERAFLSAGIGITPMMLFAISPEHKILYHNLAMEAFLARHAIDPAQGMALHDAGTRQPLSYDAWPESRALRGETVAMAPYTLVPSSGPAIPIQGAAAPVMVGDQIIAAVVVMQEQG
jgi:PAS domain S-box-containing protein